MQRCGTVEHRQAPETPTRSFATERLLQQVELPTEHASLLLSSGRRVELQAGDPHDRIRVRARDGRIVLDIQVTDAGPRLCFEAAELELKGVRTLSMVAENVSIDATRELSLSSGADLTQCVGGNRHTRVSGEERLEAASIELQANSRDVGVRAMKRIALDSEHIGLNDDPCPHPFAWSELAGDGDDDG